MRYDYDLLIVGGGLVGASLACALAGSGLRIGLVEAQPFSIADHASYDDRTLALAFATQRVFEALQLTDSLRESEPIRRIHISERGGAGIAHLDCREFDVPALGYVVPARCLGAVLNERLQRHTNIEMLCPATLEHIKVDADSARATLQLENDSHEVTARLVAAADGARSRIREQLHIPALRWDYGQSAVIANTSPQQPHDNIAFERFTETGPLALLPLSGQRCALVCTESQRGAQDLMALDDKAFLEELQRRFGDRLGRFLKIGRRQAYPLYLVKARAHIHTRTAIIGNAAHTLHPIAGQGFNLGMRDVAALAEVIGDALQRGDDIGTAATLRRYADWRRWDQRRTIAFTDGLMRLFGNPLAPVRWARTGGLLAFDLLPAAKRLLARQAMGLSGSAPRLLRGLPLKPAARMPALTEGKL